MSSFDTWRFIARPAVDISLGWRCTLPDASPGRLQSAAKEGIHAWVWR